MIVVTGGAGFIGSNLVHALVSRGESVVVVDDLTDGRKFNNVVDADIADFYRIDDFYARLANGEDLLRDVRAVFHQGACSDTTEWNGDYMMRINYEYSKLLLDTCNRAAIPLIYASSAAVYGSGSEFVEERANERPINLYGYSKHLFDRYVLRQVDRRNAQVAGLRYFNVYGPREAHKERMASVAMHIHQQILDSGTARLFAGCDGYSDGEQRRDFIHVDDVVAVNLWLLDNPDRSGVFNVGTGRSQSFNDVANAVVAWHGRGKIEYTPFPEDLIGRYQSFTEANIDALRAAGYENEFLDVSAGVKRYLDWINSRRNSQRSAQLTADNDRSC
jgi:ADP-L-glycero-D-manno-heptose 6-epimerase